MAKHEASRREFLVSAAVGAGAAAGAGLLPGAVVQGGEVPKPAEAAAPAQTHSAGEGLGAFFNRDEAATIAAFTEQLMPGAPGKPGALDAGVLNYIDRALSGAYSDQQDFYRRGLSQLEAFCRKTYSKPFLELNAAQQDEVIAALEAGKASQFEYPTAEAFFNTLRRHTIEGMFADPIYGGNKDFAGWRLVGFPGAQIFYSPGDMDSKQAFTRVSIMGLQSQADEPAGRG